MTRRTTINLGLFVFVLALAGAAFLASEQDSAETYPPLTGLSPASINDIRIKGQSGRLIHLERQGGEWIMTLPQRRLADTQRINGLLRIATTPSFLQVPARGRTLEDYGLAAPTAMLTLNDRRLSFGSTEPVNFRRYVLIDGLINLIDDGFFHHLVATPDAFVARGSND